MAMWKNDDEMFALMKEKLYTPVVGDILDQMGFHPIIKNVTRMDPRIFQEGLMGLKEQVHD